jgi:hypothetical protein
MRGKRWCNRSSVRGWPVASESSELAASLRTAVSASLLTAGQKSQKLLEGCFYGMARERMASATWRTERIGE